MVPLQQHHHEATLTDASQLYRVCSSRPQRGLQLFRFGDFQYKPVFEPRFYEGKDVESITQLV